MANEQWIKDSKGNPIGWIEFQNTGDKVLKDYHGKTLGTYRKKQDVTVDYYGNRIGQGDILLTLLH